MRKKVTIQDIADALGVSRNTVSKAINNSEGLADATREKILCKAVEMGYKQFSYVSLPNAVFSTPETSPGSVGEANEIALFTTAFLTQSHFASPMLDKLQRDLSQLGYTLNTHRITPEMRSGGSLPITFRRERTAAVVCVEMFDRSYDEMVCALGLPILFIDAPPKSDGRSLPADQLYMENATPVTGFVLHTLRQGKTRIGFIGNYEHCQSFFERFAAFRCTMLLAGRSVEAEHIIKSHNVDDMAARLSALRELPEVFLCANDFIATDAIQILRALGKRVPEDVEICGFDDSPESRLITPKLTTVHIHTQTMAFSAVQLLMTRIKEPSLDYRTVYTETDLIYRESAGIAADGEE